MPSQSIVFSLFLIFAGAAVAATIALYARQAMLVAYIAVGVLFGPWGLGFIPDAAWIKDVSAVGIMFLLYLLGMNLLPQQLLRMLGEALWVTLASSVVFFLLGVGVGYGFGYTHMEAGLIGAVVMFSSTIIGLKLLPTTALHHRHAGQVIISVLLLQDLLAIAILIVLHGYGASQNLALDMLKQLVYLPMLIGAAYGLEHYVLDRWIARFDQIPEYVFLLAIAWCLGIAQLAHMLGLSHEIGAFIAGVVMATSPIALFIAESLKPLRDFFLILFFFSLGASLNLPMLTEVAIPAGVLALLMLACKPVVFRALLRRAGEKSGLSTEIGVRLGQISEFALLIAVLALEDGVISPRASYLIQLSTLLSFVVSSYWIVMRYPTPIAVSDRLRRD
jgi:Kef-type K+ transport system membrane component KefB